MVDIFGPGGEAGCRLSASALTTSEPGRLALDRVSYILVNDRLSWAMTGGMEGGGYPWERRRGAKG